MAMEEAQHQLPSSASPAVFGNSGRSRLQRHALRSAAKGKEEKPKEPELSNPSVSKRGKSASSLSESVGGLNLSSKEKSASKPPRRLSTPAKASAVPAPKQVGRFTPITETRTRRAANGQGKSETPKKLNNISKASYWLNQIKLSESAAKHSVSLGFFKLALEAGCEPIHSMRGELKSYIQRHELNEHGEDVKQLLKSYNPSENKEMLVSERCTGIPQEETQSSNNDVLSTSTVETGKLKPKCLNIDSAQLSIVTESAKKATGHKNAPTSKASGSLSKSSTNARSASENIRKSARKIAEKPKKVEPATKEKGKISKKQEKKSDVGEAPSSPTQAATQLGNKENLDVQEMEASLMAAV